MSSSLVPFPIHVCGIEELEGHCATGVSHVLSILDPDRAGPSDQSAPANTSAAAQRLRSPR